MMLLLSYSTALALTPAEILAGRPAAERTVQECQQASCDREAAADAVFLLAIAAYVDTGVPDPDLGATVRVLDPGRHALLPPVYADAEGTPAAWASRVGGLAASPPDVMDGVVAQELPRPAVSHPALRALLGEKAVSVSAPGHLEGELARLEALERDQKYRSAIAGYRKLYDSADSDAGAEVAALRIARIYVQLGRDAPALEYYDLIRSRELLEQTAGERALVAWMSGEGRRVERTLERRLDTDPLARPGLDYLETTPL